MKLILSIIIVFASINGSSQIFDIPDLDGNFQTQNETSVRNSEIRSSFFQAANFPDSLSNYNYGLPKTGGIYCNMDNDPEQEIVFGVGTVLYAKNLDASDVIGWPKTLTTNFEINWAPAFGDIDGDGNEEIIVSAGGTTGGTLQAFNKDGSIVTGFPILIGKFPLMPVLADLDSNNTMEIILGKYINSSIGQMYVYNGDGTTYNGWPFQLGEYPASSVAVGDIDGDGSKEIIGESRNKLWAWDRNGNVKPGFPFDLDSTDVTLNSYSAPIIVDIDNNGSKEIVFAAHNPGGIVYVLNNDGSLYNGWPRSTPNWIYGAPIAADIDGDNFMEIIIGDQISSTTPSSYLFFFEHNGITKDSIGPIHAINNQVTVADIDNDGKYEFMVDENQQTGVKGSYMCYDDDFSPMTNWPIFTFGNTYFNQLLVGDLNNNGNFDLVGSGADLNTSLSYLNHWNSNDLANQMIINPVYQLNTYHDGYYRDEVYTSINKKTNSINQLIAYPNPFKNELNINFKGITKVDIYDLTGKIIYKEQVNNKSTLVLTTSKWTKGIYFVKCTHKNGVSKTVKIIKS